MNFDGMTMEAKRELFNLLTRMIYAPMKTRGEIAVHIRDKLIDNMTPYATDDDVRKLEAYLEVPVCE